MSDYLEVDELSTRSEMVGAKILCIDDSDDPKTIPYDDLETAVMEIPDLEDHIDSHLLHPWTQGETSSGETLRIRVNDGDVYFDLVDADTEGVSDTPFKFSMTNSDFGPQLFQMLANGVLIIGNGQHLKNGNFGVIFSNISSEFFIRFYDYSTSSWISTPFRIKSADIEIYGRSVLAELDALDARVTALEGA